VADELPPVIARFIADIADFTAPLREATQSLADFQAALDKSTTDVRDFAVQSAGAGATAAAAMKTAADAAQNQAEAESELTAAVNAAASATETQSRAAIENAMANEMDAAATRSERDAALEAAAAQKAQNDTQRDAIPGLNDVIRLMKQLNAAQHDVAASGHDAAAATSFWKKHFQLSGGLFGMMPILGSVSGIELVLHGLMEFFAVFIPAVATATIGITAWGIAAYTAGKEVYEQLKNASTVSDALNQHVGPLKGSFQQLAAAVRPQVYELFGEYLDMSAHNSGALANLVTRVGGALDHMFATLEVHTAKGGSGLQNFFDAGIADFHLFGEILRNLGAGIGAFAEAAMKTHIAEILLAIAAAASKLFTIIAMIPAPLLTAFVAVHGAALWGGLAVTQLKNLVLSATQSLSGISMLNGPLTAFARDLGASHDQLAAMGEASPGVRRIADDLASGVPGAYQMANALELSDKSIVKITSKTSAVESVAKALGASAQDVASFAVAASKSGVGIENLAAKAAGGTDELAKLTGGMEKGVSDAANLAMAYSLTSKEGLSAAEAAGKVAAGTGEAAASTGMFSGALGALGAALPGGPVAWIIALSVAVAGVGVYLGMMPDKTQRWINTLNQSVHSASNLNMLGTTMSALAADTAQLANAQKTATGNTTELASTQAGLSGDLQRELVHVGALQKAYGVSMPQALALLQKAGVKSTDLFQAQGQAWQVDLEMVHGLTQGYQAMGQSIGAIGSDMNVLAVSESQQLSTMSTLNSAYDQFTQLVSAPYSSMMTMAQGMQTFATDSQAAGASMSGLGTNALTLQQQFQTVYGNVEQAFDAFRSSQALTGSGDFTQYVKDSVAALLPLAGTSETARAEVSALAQEAGGPASTSLQALSRWAGNVKDPLAAMYSASQKATIGSSNLNQDAARLTSTLQSQLNPAIAQATMTSLGGQQSLTAFADAVIKTGANSKQTITAGRQVAEMFLSVDKNTKSAKAQFVGWGESLGLTAKQATNLWDKVSAGEKPLESVRHKLASTSEAVTNLGKPGTWGHIEHFFMALWDSIVHGLTVAYRHVARVMDNLWHVISSGVSRAYDSAVRYVASIFLPWWRGHGAELVTVAKHAWEELQIVIRQAWDVISSVSRVAGKSLLSVISGVLDILKAIFIVAWDIIKGVVVTAFHVIVTIIQTAMKMILDVVGVVLDILTGHWHRAWSDAVNFVTAALDGIVHVIEEVGSGFGSLLYDAGRALIEGLIHGISSMAGGAWNAVTGVAKGLWNAATSALGISSPSKVFAQIGEMVVIGLSLGISRNAQKAIDESRRLAQAISQAAASGQITSGEELALKKQLSTALHDAITRGLQTGLTGTSAQINGAIKKVFNAIAVAVSAHQLSPSQDSSMVAWLNADNKKLQNLAQRRLKLAQTIAQAETYMKSTSQAAESSASLGAVVSSSSGTATPSIKSIISTLGKDLAQIRQFKSNILKLQKMGLNKQYISQLIAAGPQAAGAIAAELAAGSWSQIHEINVEKSAILQASNQLGIQAADVMYDSGKKAGQGFLSGLKGQQAAITQMMKKIADALVAQLKKDLKIASPSVVMMEHGKMVAEGFARGIESGVTRVQKAAKAMTAATSTGSLHGSVLTSTSSSMIVINLRSEITGRVDKQVLWTAVQQETFRYNIRNSGQVTGGLKPGSA